MKIVSGQDGVSFLQKTAKKLRDKHNLKWLQVRMIN